MQGDKRADGLRRPMQIKKNSGHRCYLGWSSGEVSWWGIFQATEMK